MTSSYANGRDVLPPELLAEVQKHCTGLVWIPSPRTFLRERRQLILTLREEGVPTKEIARLEGITTRRVCEEACKEHGRFLESFDGLPG